MAITERNIQQIGKSFLITLPKQWATAFNLKKGSKLKIMTSEQGNLLISPEFIEKKASRETEMVFDSYFKRKFYREYLEGNDRITIILKNGAEKDRKEIRSFLKNFMNIQIIDESESKIVLKCFKIEELSIEECLKRMYFLSLNLFEDIGREKSGIQEIRDIMTRFYYMLVMQTRRFLSEGKFTKENQIPIIRALDFRMAAEKVQRVGAIISGMEGMDKELLGLFGKARKNYSDSVLYFIGNDYGKAIVLWKEIKDERVAAEKLCARFFREKNIRMYKKTQDILEILRYAKEISMLIR
ncbi:MAG: hypothetical protein WC475_04625 [Candidatus Paceibacterota bacterium]